MPRLTVPKSPGCGTTRLLVVLVLPVCGPEEHNANDKQRDAEPKPGEGQTRAGSKDCGEDETLRYHDDSPSDQVPSVSPVAPVSRFPHAETPIPSLRHTSIASEDGRSSLVEECNETRQLPAHAGAETPVGNCATGKRRRRGRRRKARSMGRYPFLEASNAYQEFVRPFVADLTHKARGRKLRMIARALADRGVTSHPAKWGEREIGALVGWMKDGGFEPEYQAKLLQYVRGLLRFAGNPVLERMTGARIVRLPQGREARLCQERPLVRGDDGQARRSLELGCGSGPVRRRLLLPHGPPRQGAPTRSARGPRYLAVDSDHRASERRRRIGLGGRAHRDLLVRAAARPRLPRCEGAARARSRLGPAEGRTPHPE